jgi:transcriptional regulator with XRE-family HTH domain
MKNENLVRYLRELAASARPRQLSEEEVDDLLAPDAESENESDIEGVSWPRFVEAVLDNLYSEPIKTLGDKKTLGDFLLEARRATNFTREDIAAAVGKDVSFIEQIETSSPQLSSFDPEDTADLMTLLRIHIEVLEQMLPKRPVIQPKRSGESTGMITLSDGSSTRMGEFEAVLKLSERDAKWLNDVRSALERRDQLDLIF